MTGSAADLASAFAPTFTAIRIERPSSDQIRDWRSASVSTHWVNGTISPLCSATGTNSPGARSPRSGCCQPDERLDAADGRARELDDGLVVQKELAVRDRCAEPCEGLKTGELLLLAPRGRDDRAPTLRLGFVERDLHSADELRRAARVIGVASHGDPRFEVDLGARDHEWRGDRGQHGLGGAEGCVACSEPDPELVRAGPRDVVAAFRVVGEALTDRVQQLVSDLVPE